MPSSYGRCTAAAIFVLALAISLFAHADTTPTAAQLLLQALTPPTPVIPYNNSTIASTSPSAPQGSSAASVPIGVSLPNMLPLNASLMPQESSLPGAFTASTAVSASSTTTLIQSLYAELKNLEAEIAALEATSPVPACAPHTLSRSLDLGTTGSDVTALQKFLQSKGYYTYASITGYFGPATEKAVAAFQSENGISSVGSVGPRSHASCSTSIRLASPSVRGAPSKAT